MLTALQDSQHN